MLKQGKMILLGLGVVAALGFGGSALAAAGAAPVTPTVEQTTGPDNDQIQSGNQTAPDTATEAPGTEAQDSSSQGPNDTEMQDGSQESSGSEVPNNDGPGGHADEPGNPNADHQASGQQE